MMRERALSQPNSRSLGSTHITDTIMRDRFLTEESHRWRKLKITDELKSSMRQKSVKRGFRANLASTVSFPNRQPQSSELVLAMGRAAKRQPDTGPLLIPFQERTALSARAFELCRKSLPNLRGAPPKTVHPALKLAERLGAIAQLNPDESLLPPPESSPSKSKTDSKGTHILRGQVTGSTRRTSLFHSSAGDSAKAVDETKTVGRLGSKAKTVGRLGSKRTALTAPGKVLYSELPPASTDQVGYRFPSVRDALERFNGTKTINSQETERMRIVFARLAGSDVTQINRDSLPDALTMLGYIGLTDEDEISDMAQDTNQFASMDFTDFNDFLLQASMTECQILHEKCGAWIESQQSRGSPYSLEKGLQVFMESELGILCTEESVKGFVFLGGIGGWKCTSAEVLLRFVAAYRAMEGFTEEDLQELQEAFDECDEQTGLGTGEEGKMIKAAEIQNGLLSWAGLYCVDQLKELLENLQESLEIDRPLGCGFYEFVVCARRLRQLMLWEVYEQFESLMEENDDEENIITGENLRELLKPLGFSLVDAEFNEFLDDQDITEESELDFDACWKFVLAVREANGFTKEESEELEAAFDSFCDSSGEMPNLAVAELLEYIGFENTLEQVMFMVRKVDFNGNGTMDSGEFMRLMRIQREESLATYDNVYREFRLSKPCTKDNLAAALTECHIPPGIKIMESLSPLLAEHGAERGLSFEGFLQIAETCRRLYPVEKRKRAHFKEEEVALIQAAFAQQDTAGVGYISLGDLLNSLADSGLPVNTIPGRGKIVDGLERARESARKAGVTEEECGAPGSPRVRVVQVVHLVREILKKHNKEVSQRQEAAMKSITFTAADVKDFRHLFNTMADSPPDHSTLTLTKVLQRFKFIPHVSVDNVLSLTQSSKFRVAAKLKKDLSARIMKLASSRGVDFPGFVQIMQWMVEQNYGEGPRPSKGEHSFEDLDDLAKLRSRRKTLKTSPTP